MNIYLNNLLDRMYLDAVLWRYKYPVCKSSPAAMYTRDHCETPRDSAALLCPLL